MRVCASCGLVAPEAAKACEGCEAPLDAAGAAREAEGASSGAAWVSVRCSFDCRVCGRRSPLDHLDADGVIFCMLCGTEQAFAPRAWRALLELAHDLGDLGWPKPEGRNPHAEISIERANPYHDVGVRSATRVWAEERSETANPLHAKLGPGHPLCRTCHEPLAAAPEGATARVSCARCHEEVVYTVPEAARKAHASLVAVLADEHRRDHAAARIEQGSATAAVAVACPSCGASLVPDAKSPLLTCAYCKTVSRVPARAFHGLTGAEPRVEPFWLLLAGPSAARRAITGKLEEKARRRKAHDEDGARRDEQQRRRGAHGMSDGERVTRNKWLTALWFVVCLGAGAALILTVEAYDRRFGLPGFLEAAGIPALCVVFWGVLYGPSLFFGMPWKRKETWQPTDAASPRWGLVAMAVFFVVSAAAIAALAPGLASEPAPRPRAPIRR